MIVELYGLPGCGKSTFARALERDGGWVRVRVSGKREILFWATCFALLHPRSVLWQLYFLLRHGWGELFYTKFVNIFLVHNAKYAKAKTLDRAIIDQGHTQNIISLFEKKLPAEVVHSYLAKLPHPDLLVYFDIDDGERERRLYARGHGVREGVSGRSEWLRASAHNAGHVNGDPRRVPMRLVCDDEGVRALERVLSSRKDVYYILNARMPTEKAYGNQVALTCDELARSGHRVELWAPLRKNPIPTHAHAYYGLAQDFTERFVRSHEFTLLKRFSKRLGYYLDALAYLAHIWFYRFPRRAHAIVRKPSLAWLLKRKGLTVLYECHDWFGGFVGIQLMFLRRVDAVVVTNTFIRNKFLEHGFSQSSVHVLPNAVDIERFARTESKGDALICLRAGGHEVPESSMRVLLYTGSLRTMGNDKGVETILRALAFLSVRDALFCAVGGSADDIAHYQKLAVTLGVSARVRFFPRVGQSDLALFQRAADVLLMPFPRLAHYEFFMSPLKTFEYMASGRPIIASSLPSIREILDESCALMVTPGDERALAQAIDRLCADSVLSQNLANAARERVDSYTLRKRVGRLSELLFGLPLSKNM